MPPPNRTGTPKPPLVTATAREPDCERLPGDLLRTHGRELTDWILRMHPILNEDDADGILAQAYVVLWKKRRKGGIRSEELGRLFAGIARRVALHAASRKYLERLHEVRLSWDPDDRRSDGPPPDDATPYGKALAEALDGLKETDRTIVLHYANCYDPDPSGKNRADWTSVLAIELKMPPGRLRVRLYRAIGKIKRQLTESGAYNGRGKRNHG
jgi:DNA-directed RNA polymerase specialized sigma24 family protein